MGIWIMAQDKKSLYNVDCFEIHETSTNGEKHKFRIRNNIALFDLGVYSSEKKALKVLNMIQDYIIKSNFVGYVNGEIDSKFYTQSDGVFQMPQEEEV